MRLRNVIKRINVAIVALSGIVVCSNAEGKQSDYLSPIAAVIDSQGKEIYMACPTSNAVEIFNTKTKKSETIINVNKGSAIAISNDGKKIYVTGGNVHGKIYEITTSDNKIKRIFNAGHTPVAPIVSKDNKILYYANRFTNKINALDLSTGKVIASNKSLREPITMQLSKDGKTLFVANHLPLMPAHLANVYCLVELYNTTNNLKKIKEIKLPAGTFAVRDSAITNSGKYLIISHIVGRFTVPTTHLDRGWINTNAISIINVETQEWVNTVLLDDPNIGAPNPWGVTVTDDDKYVVVNVSGSSEVIYVNLAKMLDRIAKAPDNKEIVNNLSFLYGIKDRVRMDGKGNRAVVTHKEFTYVPMYFSDNINVIEMWDDGPGGAVAYPLSKHASPVNDVVRLGEIAFNDGMICYQQWQSCASCHPDVRSDGTNWDLLNDGIGNPKQSRSLLYTHKTSPVMITGVRAAAEVAVRAGFKHIQFRSAPESTAHSVDEYLKSLEPIPSPFLNLDGSLTESAKRGKDIFEGEANCIRCHNGPYFGDKELYVLGKGTDHEKNRAFATPILIETWRTAPYMYDGRCVTIMDVLTTDNKDDKHGKTSKLTKQQLKDLEQYILSI